MGFTERLYRYGKDPTWYDIIKAAAIVLMVVDHIGSFFMPELQWLRGIGRLSMPLFLFLVGYSLQYKLDKTLLLFACVIVVCDITLGRNVLPLNILFTIVFVRMALGTIAKNPEWINNYRLMIGLCALFWLSTVFLVEYGSSAFFIGVAGYYARKGMTNAKPYCFFFYAAFLFNSVTQALNYHPLLCILVVIASFYEAKLLLHLAVSGKIKEPFRKLHSSRIMALSVMLASRYSLHLYVAHYILFKFLQVHWGLYVVEECLSSTLLDIPVNWVCRMPESGK